MTLVAGIDTHDLRGDEGAGSSFPSRRGPSFLMAVPALAFFACFAIVPLLGVVLLSFMKWDGLGSPEWVGLANWSRVLTDPVTHHAMKLTVVLTVATWAVQCPTSLLLGVFMAGRQRYRAVYSVLYFLPLLFSAAAIGIAFKALLDPNFGLGTALGIEWLNRDWLGNPSVALPTLVFVIAWCFIPFHLSLIHISEPTRPY